MIQKLQILVSKASEFVLFARPVYATHHNVDTAIGEIPTDMAGFMSTAARVAVSLGGAAAIGLLAYGGFTILTSTGEPERLMEGREIITNALMGLALIVLAVFVLQFLGWDILGIEEIRDMISR